MERPGFLVLLLMLIACFIVPATSIAASPTDSETMRVALAETQEEVEDYEYDREEAAEDLHSDAEFEDEADQQEEQEVPVEEEEDTEYED